MRQHKRVTLKTRVHGLYSGMTKRFAPKYWASGKRKGQLRQIGLQVPFCEADLLRWMEKRFPLDGVRPCPYCGAAIDSLSASLDHAQPISRCGSLGLDNLDAICEPCNRLKGALTSAEFKELRQWIDRQNIAAAEDIVGRLKAGAMGMRLRYYGKRA